MKSLLLSARTGTSVSRLARVAGRSILRAGVVAGLLSASLVLSTPASAAGLGVTPADQFKVPDGFEVELIHEVAADTEGSWVSLTVDPKGRLIACDQSGGLFRIDMSSGKAEVEKLDIEFVGAQGLLCAFGSLYANVNAREFPCGLWRLTDTDGDDQYDKKEHIIPLNGGSEHGPHALILTPDGERIIMVAGNNTNLPENIAHSRVPEVWDEDHLLGRMPDARGHNANRMAPGGFICSLKPDGSDIELIATGFRNPYDIALNRQGELFTYDADMEWDVGTPWYRPTRINHVISGSEFGWRNGTGKWPAYYPDSFGSAVDIGPGSPTGIVFGYGAKFPKKYENALFISDWSYGNIHAVHLSEDGSSYTGSYETFATAAPLPVTDLVIHPDGALYFAIGGRGTQSGLYRIRYTGDLSADETKPAAVTADAKQLRELRHRIEALHVDDDALNVSVEDAIQLAIANLGHEDRAIRFAARIALEHRSPAAWKDAVLNAESGQAKILGVVALARTGEASDQVDAVNALQSIELEMLTADENIDYLRAAGLVAIRLGGFSDSQRAALLDKIAGQFPSGVDSLDRELAIMAIYLNAPGSTESVLAAMQNSPSQESQIHYAMALRAAKEGWSQDLRRDYLAWFNEMKTARGGMSFGGFLDNIKKVTVDALSDEDKQSLADVLAKPKSTAEVAAGPPREFVKEWKVDDLVNVVSDSARKPNFENGKAMFAAAQCYKCHRMGLQGGILGPDLTSAGGKFSPRDMLVSIIEPSKVISDQYGSTQFLTEDGEVVTGRVINMRGGELSVMTNMLDPSSLTKVNREGVIQTRESQVSMMPNGLLDTLNEEEIADLVAYLRAGGNANHAIYTDPIATK
ncbi:c-type cytochrome [Rhodopirellula halodulae]|uniref:c-type cytochrome n=1 Tax=Rhodopirellula halodulae TaxID=2894198 RepID=UPI001E4B717B|nr:c-type cytochrome [Rhodopirellula sp. JC737]MCC9655135.1 c-type cytochrome [Rhodopirellula sp. JC737]